jgi:hypothetical protein
MVRFCTCKIDLQRRWPIETIQPFHEISAVAKKLGVGGNFVLKLGRRERRQRGLRQSCHGAIGNFCIACQNRVDRLDLPHSYDPLCGVTDVETQKRQVCALSSGPHVIANRCNAAHAQI